MGKRTRLSASAPLGCAIFTIPVAGFLILIVALMVVFAVREVSRSDFWLSSLLLLVTGVVIFFVLSIAGKFLHLALHRVWLRGPYLVERKLFVRRRVDLRAARLALTGDTLAATDPRSGRCLTIAITAADVTALADAILDGTARDGTARDGTARDGTARDHDDQLAARDVAARLRQLAP